MSGMTKEELEKLISDRVEAGLQPLKESNGGFLQQLLAGIAAQKGPANNGHTIPGQGAARIIRALAATKGDPLAASRWAQEKFGDEAVARALGTSNASSGGFLVPEEYSTEIIELLRNAAVIRKLDPTVVPMHTGVMSIPRLTAGASADYIGESTAQKATQEEVGQLRLVWKKLRATVPVSNELLAFSNPSADAMVRDDVVRALAVREDAAFLRDDGTNGKPKGMRYWAASGNVTATSATSNTDATGIQSDFKDCLDALEGHNVRMIRPAWIMAPRSKNALINLRAANGQLIFPEVRGANPTAYGFPIATTNNVPTNLGGGSNEGELYLVDMVDAVIGEATTLMIEVSTEASYTDANGNLVSAFDRDETVIKVIERHDFVMRHDYSVAVKTGLLW